MMAMTTSNSISVKPPRLWDDCETLMAFFSFNPVGP